MQRLRTRLRAGATAFPPATFALNFLTGALDSGVTFTRGTTATFVGSDGLIQTAAINAPRFDYDPVTLAAKGLLIEEQRTNLLTYSEQFDNASWVKSAASIAANAVVSPDGATDADKLVEDTANAPHFVRQNVVGVIGTSYTSTVFVKAAERTAATISHFDGAAFCGVSIDLSTGVLSAPPSDLGMTNALSTSTVSAFGNGWYRVSVQRTQVTATTVQTRVVVQNGSNGSYAGNGVSGVYVYGAQIEAAAFATSYIPTVASTVTRSADVATMTGTNFSSWYNQSEGTFVLSGDVLSSTATRVWMDVGPNGGFGTTAYIGQTPSNISLLPGSAPVNMASQVNTTALSNTVAIGLQNNNSVLSVGGVLGPVDTSCTMPASATLLAIGTPIWNLGGSATLDGHIRSIAYYNTRLSDATLQALTA